MYDVNQVLDYFSLKSLIGKKWLGAVVSLCVIFNHRDSIVLFRVRFSLVK